MAELLLLASPQIKWIVWLIAIDVVLGIIAAIMKKEFRLGKVANFMFKPIVGYVFGLAILGEVAQPRCVQVAFLLIILALIGSILNNLSRIGLTLPDYLKK